MHGRQVFSFTLAVLLVCVVYSVVALLEREIQHSDGEHVYKCASHYVAIWE